MSGRNAENAREGRPGAIPWAGPGSGVSGRSSVVSGDVGVSSDTGPFAMIPRWVLESVGTGAAALYCWLGLYADNETGFSFPARATLARRLGCSVDTVDRRARELERAGALRVVGRVDEHGRQTSNGWVVIRSRPKGEGRTDAALGGRADAAGGAAPTRPELDLEELDLEELQPRALDVVGAKPARKRAGAGEPATFAEWWAEYPRKINRKGAAKAYGRAVADGADPAVLVDSLRRWADYWRSRGDEQFIPHPTTWLNQARWEASPPAPARTRQSALDVLDDLDAAMAGYAVAELEAGR